VERLNELIDGLLDVSRIQNGRFNVEPSDSEVAALVGETVGSRLRVIAQEAGVRIQVEAPPEVRAWVDPIRFEEVVTNLGMNAIRFSPEGGSIWIRLAEEGNQLVLSVRDQGPAVPDADRRRIFEPFEKAQRTSRLGGLGLGLFISRQIAQLHGGSLTLVESVPGKGNVFEARFPLRRPAPAEPAITLSA
jgi:signal transduction histidine kinase